MKKILLPHCVEIEKIKGSRFIADVIPTQSLDMALKAVLRLKEERRSASHVCYAVRIHPKLFRYSDDGEPRNSAGMPIFQRLESLNFVECLCAVTRVYGGVKLGVGGLIRAYGKAASAALEGCKTEEIIVKEALTIVYDYSETATIDSLLGSYSNIEFKHQYLDRVITKIAIEPELTGRFIQQLKDKTSGRVHFIRHD